jgi:hypothetical protein
MVLVDISCSPDNYGGVKLRNDDKITSTILLVLFHFFYVAKPLNRLAIRSFGRLEKKKSNCGIW